MILHSFVGLFMQDQCPNACVILLEISFMITHDSHVRSYMIMHELEEYLDHAGPRGITT